MAYNSIIRLSHNRILLYIQNRTYYSIISLLFYVFFAVSVRKMQFFSSEVMFLREQSHLTQEANN